MLTISPQATSALDCPTRRRLPQLLRRSWYGLNQAFRRRIAPIGVTPDQFTVLRTLLEAPAEGLTQRELTEAISSDPNTVASLLERMSLADWVERRPHERDRRAYRIRIRPLGMKMYDDCRAIAVALQAEVLNEVPVAEREYFLVHLETLALACRKAADTSPKANGQLPE